MVANMVHAWRNKFQADKLLNKLPPAFEFFQQNLTLKPLLVTPQGYVVLLLKVGLGWWLQWVAMVNCM